jgi:hypothetical protein
VSRQNIERALWLQIDSILSLKECDSIDIQTVEVVLFMAVEVCLTQGYARRRETFYTTWSAKRRHVQGQYHNMIIFGVVI